jgi:hypothetical protein
MILLNMSMTDMINYGAIYNARTVAQPEGCAATAWKILLAIYKPITPAIRHELEQEKDIYSVARAAAAGAQGVDLITLSFIKDELR